MVFRSNRGQPLTTARILIFGEGKDDYDRRAIEHLIHALAPAGVTIRSRRHRKPIILDRGANRRRRLRMAEEVAILEDEEWRTASSQYRVVVVGFHDCDALEPAHREEGRRIEADLAGRGVRRPVAAVPAWCIEAWWILFPEALARTRQCWRPIKVPGNVGSIPRAKEHLRQALRNTAIGSCRDYHEGDSVTIARHVRECGLASDARTGRSASLVRFRDRLRAAIVDADFRWADA